MVAPVYLMSPPTVGWRPRGGANYLSEKSRGDDVPPGAALRDWLQIADAIVAAGGRIQILPPPPGDTLTGLPYTAEAGHLTADDKGPIFLLPNLRPEHRRAEAGPIATYCDLLHWRTATIKATWEAQGDLFRFADGRSIHTYGTGKWARTEKAAFKEVQSFFPQPALSLGFKADPWFHGNTLLGIYREHDGGREHVLVCEDALLPGEMARLTDFVDEVPVTISREESLGFVTNALQVRDTVIAPEGCSDRAVAWWGSLGLDVIFLDIPVLFRRGGGAAVCLTNKLGASTEIPPELDYVNLRQNLMEPIRQ